MAMPFHKMFFLSNLKPTTCLNVAKFHLQTSTKLKKEKHCCNVDCLKSFKLINALVDAVLGGCTAICFIAKIKPTYVLYGTVFL